MFVNPGLEMMVSILQRLHIVCVLTSFFTVILPQLAAMSAYTSQMSNQTRKVDMASALLESFSAAIYCPLNKNTISTSLLPGLK